MQVLHVAVLRRRVAVLLALLDAGIPPNLQNSHRWTPLDEAVSLKDKGMVMLLHARETATTKADLKAKKGDLLRSLTEMPDYSFQVGNWRSPLIHLFLQSDVPCLSRHAFSRRASSLCRTWLVALRGVLHLQLKWELGSPVLGLLLRKYAPNDTYEVRFTPHLHGPSSLLWCLLWAGACAGCQQVQESHMQSMPSGFTTRATAGHIQTL